MKFDELDKKMRVFETNSDHCVLPGMQIIARLDGRNFTTLTKKNEQFDAPFDERFRDLMVDTTKYLMQNTGFNVIYGYTESDEISLLLSPDTKEFGRKTRKLNSILSGEASAIFTKNYGDVGVFDCRISELPTTNNVVDYFRWRNEDAHRNSLSGWVYWTARKSGMSVSKATAFMKNMLDTGKNEYLFQKGINYNELPSWQKRGIGLYWQTAEKYAYNQYEKKQVKSLRNILFVNYELPMKQEYSEFLEDILRKNRYEERINAQ
ncbi:MAG: guanylyltransferase [Ignavibacteria bacterium]|jgi:tRNA(His) 5'-end guanylyltransferase|nr:guanylyltransferase [Ignavibacteria bacterium]